MWHVWRDAAYVLTGPGEQDVPGLGDAPLVTVSVASKDTGGLLVRWAARVSRVEPGSAEWSGIIGALLAGRLNEPESPGAPSPAERWAQTGNVYRLTPRLRDAETAGPRSVSRVRSRPVRRLSPSAPPLVRRRPFALPVRRRPVRRCLRRSVA